MNSNYQSAQINIFRFIWANQTEVPERALTAGTGGWWLILAICDAFRCTAENFNGIFNAAFNVYLGHVGKEKDTLVEARFEQSVT